MGTMRLDDDDEIVEVTAVSEDEPPPCASEEVEVLFDVDPEIAPAAVPPGPQAPATEDGDARERHLRLLADFENLRRRAERERIEMARTASLELVRRLLPVLDSLERALAAPATPGSDEAFRGGVALIHHQLCDELRREGLRAVESVGATFDPNVHEAVATDGAADVPVGTVVGELQRGYFFGDRLLRPARVRVRTGEPDGSPGGCGGEES